MSQAKRGRSKARQQNETRVPGILRREKTHRARARRATVLFRLVRKSKVVRSSADEAGRLLVHPFCEIWTR